MITARDLIALFQRMYREHWAYKWGSAETGCVDCAGAFVWAYRQFGESIYHGSNRIARSYVKELLPISRVKPGMAVFKARKPGQQYYDLPAEYRQGGARYNGDLNDYYHIGLADGEYVLNAQSAKTGFVRSKIQGWACCGELKAVTYSEENMRRQVTGGKLNLRKSASQAAAIITQIPDGATVTVLEYGETWCQVAYEGRTGWCMTKYLEEPQSGGVLYQKVKQIRDLADELLKGMKEDE